MSATSTLPPTRRRPRLRAFAVPAALLALAATMRSDGGEQTMGTPLAVRVVATGCTAIPIHGGGVALGGSRVATMAHVVAGATEVRVSKPDGRDLGARVVAIDTERDVALLDVDGLAEPRTTTATLGEGDRGSFVGEVDGRPARVAFTVVRAASIVSEDIYVKGRHARPGYILRAAVTRGDSGAGLVRADGALGGLVWAASRNDDDEGWAVAMDALQPLISSAPAGAPPAPAVPCSPP